MHVIQSPRFGLIVPCPSNDHVKGKGSGKEWEGLRNTTYHPKAGQVMRLPAQIPVPNATRKEDSRLAVIHESAQGDHPTSRTRAPTSSDFDRANFSKAPMIETGHRTSDWSSSEKPAMAGGVQGTLLSVYYKEWRYKMSTVP